MLIAIDDFEEFLKVLREAAESGQAGTVWYDTRLSDEMAWARGGHFVGGFLMSGYRVVCRIPVATTVLNGPPGLRNVNEYSETVLRVADELGVVARRGMILDGIADQLSR